jgi:hypothetical protein
MISSNGRIGVRQNEIVSNVVVRPHNSSAVKMPLTANFAAGGFGNNSMSLSGTSSTNTRNMDLMMTGLIPGDNEGVFNRYYRDIYYYDSVAGSTVDLMSNMPFGEFSIQGLEESKIKKFESSVSCLDLINLLPQISMDYLVNGAFCSTLIWDSEEGIFQDSITFDPAALNVKLVPMYSRDPLIIVNPDSTMVEFARSTDPYMVKVKRSMPRKLLEAISSGKPFTPDPNTTLYIPRKVFSHSYVGTSLFKRILPIYLLEKLLLRGTIVEAGRRMRSIFHIQVGDNDWEPTPDELSYVTQMFQQADFDPLGAIVTTRNGVTTQEVRQGGDFWKYTDIVGDTTSIKLRALGISEAFLSSEVNYSTSEVALSTFLENLAAYRHLITRKVFHDKIFPLVAIANRFIKPGAPSYITEPDKDVGIAVNDIRWLEVPHVRWFKHLGPTNDRDTFDMLQALSDHGIPVTLRMWAAAGGLSLENIMRGLEEDVKDRQQLQAILEKSGLADQYSQGDNTDPFANESREPSDEFASFNGSKLRKVGLLNREFTDEIYQRDSQGRRHIVSNEREHATKQNEIIAKTVKSMKQRGKFEEIQDRLEARLSKTSGIFGKI